MRTKASITATATVAAIATAVCACSPPPRGESGATKRVGAAVDTGTPAPPTPPAPPSGGGSTTAIATDDFEFDYAYPAEAAAIPALKARLDAERTAALAAVRRDAVAARANAKANGYDIPGYGYDKKWQRVADVPGWLSLSATVYEFTGGAHGMTVYDALLWDRRGARAIDPIDAFASKAAVDGAIRAPFCQALDAQRLEKRGAMLGADSGFTACIDPSAYPILFGSSNGRTFDRISVMVPPYEAGPYAEGTYEVDLPVTAALIAALKPQFRPAFSAK